ncbi:unnamed protein product [Rotaria sp. Silwood1]|nr:unnamed protein product [Rotaria sp. Silwood1]CAF3783878.1 unnamed protein product [Rotaria sp. Silwood1]CAF3962521.1 unnamed protein product [Rotaria sp. Silwood1]CAF5017093.1 unnamed protein product [Rotaria sp. Silwood1]CAF5024452.1 unnamed protein product [Rotaria sp. Silwood1]
MTQQFSKLLRITKETVPVYYDTTFSLGEIYVSVLAYKHVMFIEQSIVPLAILFHDYKKERSHNRFIQILNYEIPEIGKNCVLITDCEDALKNAFHSYYPNVEQLRCWNHLGKNIKAAAKK